MAGISDILRMLMVGGASGAAGAGMGAMGRRANDPNDPELRLQAIKEMMARERQMPSEQYIPGGERVPTESGTTPMGSRDFEDDQFVQAEPIGFQDQFYPNASRMTPKGIRGGDTMGTPGQRQAPRGGGGGGKMNPNRERDMREQLRAINADPAQDVYDLLAGTNAPDPRQMTTGKGPYIGSPMGDGMDEDPSVDMSEDEAIRRRMERPKRINMQDPMYGHPDVYDDRGRGTMAPPKGDTTENFYDAGRGKLSPEARKYLDPEQKRQARRNFDQYDLGELRGRYGDMEDEELIETYENDPDREPLRLGGPSDKTDRTERELETVQNAMLSDAGEVRSKEFAQPVQQRLSSMIQGLSDGDYDVKEVLAAIDQAHQAGQIDDDQYDEFMSDATSYDSDETDDEGDGSIAATRKRKTRIDER